MNVLGFIFFFLVIFSITLQFPGVLAYCMSKSAIDQFTRCVALGKAVLFLFIHSP